MPMHADSTVYLRPCQPSHASPGGAARRGSLPQRLQWRGTCGLGTSQLPTAQPSPLQACAMYLHRRWWVGMMRSGLGWACAVGELINSSPTQATSHPQSIIRRPALRWQAPPLQEASDGTSLARS
jgi:hypothetical protein